MTLGNESHLYVRADYREHPGLPAGCFFATMSKVRSPKLTCILMESALTLPVYFIVTSLPLKLRTTLNDTSSPFTDPVLISAFAHLTLTTLPVSFPHRPLGETSMIRCVPVRVSYNPPSILPSDRLLMPRLRAWLP